MAARAARAARVPREAMAEAAVRVEQQPPAVAAEAAADAVVVAVGQARAIRGAEVPVAQAAEMPGLPEEQVRGHPQLREVWQAAQDTDCPPQLPAGLARP